MIIDSLNLNLLRIFDVVFRTKSMTVAAHELHLTQSGVSQHVRALEDALSVKLFDRVKQRLVPTTAASVLYKQCSQRFLEIEQILWHLKGGEKQLGGTVSVGMPIEFGNNIVIPLLSSFSKKHPLVKYQIEYDLASALNEKLLNGELDFAFVDDFRMDARITTEKVFDEVLELCIAEKLLKEYGPPVHSKEFFEALPYVDYREGAPILTMWFGHHLKTRRLHLSIRAAVMDVQGVARFILTGMGAGVLPSHVISKLRHKGLRLHCFKGCGQPLVNMIHVAYLEARTQSASAQSLLAWLKEAMVSRSGTA